MPFVVWLIIRAFQWAAMLFVAVVAVRLATSLITFWRLADSGRRRDAKWLLGWLVMLAVAMALLHCQAGDFYSFRDPAGNDWNFDAHGWPLAEPCPIIDRYGGRVSPPAVYFTAIAFDLICSLLLLIATRLVLDRWLTAWDSLSRRSALLREAAGFGLAIVAILTCERFVTTPITLPGTAMMIYTPLVHESATVRVGMLLGLASAVVLLGLGFLRGIAAARRLRDEGVI
ncbi:MAG TPA: hypothetical protein VHC22_23935 [Pirellulales bacterium]|nr:hypothetical protein [Pirellulales bacterium]